MPLLRYICQALLLPIWSLGFIWLWYLRRRYFSPARCKQFRSAADKAADKLWQQLQEDRLLESIARDGEPKDATRQTALELCRFFVLHRALKGRGYAVFGAVDRLWHRLLERPESYRRFCASAFGVVEIPHRPGASPSDSYLGYRRLLRDYRLAFGAPAPKDLWGKARIDSKGETHFHYYGHSMGGGEGGERGDGDGGDGGSGCGGD